MNDYYADESFNKGSRILHILTWEFQSAVNLYGQMNIKLWLYCAIVFVWTAFLPICFNLDYNEVVTVFCWGAVKPGFMTFELAAGAVQLFYPPFVFFPMYSLLARWSNSFSTRRNRVRVTPYEVFLFIIELVFSCACFFLVFRVLAQVPGAFVSPLFYILVINNLLLLYQLFSPCFPSFSAVHDS